VNSENSCLEQPVLNVRRIREGLKVWMPDGNTHLRPMCCAFASARRLFNRTCGQSFALPTSRGKPRLEWFTRTWCKGCAFAPSRVKRQMPLNRTCGQSKALPTSRGKPRLAWFTRTWCKGAAFAPSRGKHHEVVLTRTTATRTGGSTRVKERKALLNRTWCKGAAFAPSRVKRQMPLNRTEQAPGQCPDHERPSRSSRRPAP